MVGLLENKTEQKSSVYRCWNAQQLQDNMSEQQLHNALMELLSYSASSKIFYGWSSISS
jgi:hypothetical protein